MGLKPDSRFLGDRPTTMGQFLAKWLALLESIMNEQNRQDFLKDLTACTAPFPMGLKPDSRFLGDPPATMGQFLAKWLALLEPIMNEEDRQDFLEDLTVCTAPFAGIGGRRLSEGLKIADKGDDATEAELCDALRALQSLDDMGKSANAQIEGMISDLQKRLAAKRAKQK